MPLACTPCVEVSRASESAAVPAHFRSGRTQGDVPMPALRGQELGMGPGSHCLTKPAVRDGHGFVVPHPNAAARVVSAVSALGTRSALGTISCCPSQSRKILAATGRLSASARDLQQLREHSAVERLYSGHRRYLAEHRFGEELGHEYPDYSAGARRHRLQGYAR